MSRKTSVSQTQWENQREDILIAIDQLSQMTEVMNDVLFRVKQQVDILDRGQQRGKKEYSQTQNTTPNHTKRKTPKKTSHHNKKVNKIDVVH